ncbi:MAG: hypothetical protein KAR79_05645, partial [Simkaniaceae bacterium]|nr:hypothetical protein [Simkaniaceae bacterium]
MQAVPFINMQQLIQLQHDLQNDPNNDDLKGLIWQAKWNLCSLRNGIPLEASDFSPRLQGLLECRFPHYIPREPLTPLGMLQNSLNLEPSTAEILYSLQEVDNQLPNFSSAVLHQFYKDNHHLELEKNRPSLRAAVEHTLLLATSHLSSDDQDRIYGEIYRNTDPLPDEPHYGENHLLDNWDRFALVATDVPFLIENDPNEFLSECMQPLRALLEEKAAGGDSEELQERIRNAENAASVSRNIYKSLTYIGLIPNNALGALQNTLIDTCHEIEMSEQVRGEIIQDLFLQIEETIPGFTRALRDQFPDHAPLENLLHFRIAIEQTLFRAFREQLSPDQQEACFGRIWGNTDPRPNEPFYGEVHLLDCWDRFGESIDPHTLRFQTTFDQVRKLIEDRYQNPEDAALLEALINAQEDHIIERNQTEALGPYVDNPGTTELGKLQNMLSRNHVFFRHSDIINSLERQEDVFPGFTAEVLIRLEKDTGGVNLQNFQNLRIAIELTLLEGFYQQLEPEEREGFYLEMAGRSLDEHTEDYYFETHLLDCWEEFGMGIQPRRLHFHSGDLDLDPLRALIREQKAQPDQMDLQERVQNAQSILCRARNGAPIHPEEMQRCGLNLVIPPHINRAINPFPQTLLGQLQNQLRTGARIWEIRDLLKQIDRECIPGFSQALQHELNKSPEQPINRDIRVAAEMTLLRLFGEQLNPAEQEEVYGNIWRNSTSRPNLDSFGQTNLLECWDRFAISIPEGKLRLAPTKIDYSPLRALIQQRNNHPDRAGLQDYVKATEELFCKLRNGMPL